MLIHCHNLRRRSDICWHDARRQVSCWRKRITSGVRSVICADESGDYYEPTEYIETFAGGVDFRRFSLESFGEWLRASRSGRFCDRARRGVCRHGGQSVGHLLQSGGHHAARRTAIFAAASMASILNPAIAHPIPPRTQAILITARIISPLFRNFFTPTRAQGCAVEFWAGRLCALSAGT